MLEREMVAFDEGCFTGSNFGYEIKDQVDEDCGEKFVVTPGFYFD